MRGAEAERGRLVKQDKNDLARAMSESLGAYRGDTPYQMSQDKMFPGEQPIEGLRNKGTGQNVNAMAQAMMGSGREELMGPGLKALMAQQGGEGPGMGKYNPGDFTPNSWAEFMQSRDPRVLKRYEPYQVVDIAGVPTLVARGDQAATQTTKPLSNLEAETGAAAEKASETEKAKLEQQALWKPRIEEAVTLAKAKSQERGEAFTDLQRAEAAMPGLQQSVAELKELAGIATSTIGGRAWDAVVKETGFGATEGATARAKFIAIVNNQVLPLLKPTFGAAFTVQEGESLKATMGDPNATPQEKIAQLDAFIEQKYRDIQTKQRQLGVEAEDMSTLSTEELQAIIDGN